MILGRNNTICPVLFKKAADLVGFGWLWLEESDSASIIDGIPGSMKVQIELYSTSFDLFSLSEA